MAFFRCRPWRGVGWSFAIAFLAAATATGRVCAAQEPAKAENNRSASGMFPNFYTSFQWDAGPLSAKQKFGLAGRSLVDPVLLLTIAGAAGVQQANDSYPGYGSGAQGYGKRFGADLADTVSDRMLGGAVLPSILHQDPRYFYKGTGSVRSRLRYALGEAFLCRSDNGNRQVNYSNIGGTLMTAGLSNAYRADVDRRASTTFTDAAVLFGGHMVNNVIREFLFKRMMAGTPGYAGGKP